MAKKKPKPADTQQPPPQQPVRLPVLDLKDGKLEETGEFAKPVRLN